MHKHQCHNELKQRRKKTKKKIEKMAIAAIFLL